MQVHASSLQLETELGSHFHESFCLRLSSCLDDHMRSITSSVHCDEITYFLIQWWKTNSKLITLLHVHIDNGRLWTFNLLESALLRKHCCPSGCFLGCANWETFVADTKCFWTKSETFFVSRTQNLCPQQMLRARENGETFVSATMCPQQCVLVCQGPVSRKTRLLNGPDIIFWNQSLKKSRVCFDF